MHWSTCIVLKMTSVLFFRVVIYVKKDDELIDFMYNTLLFHHAYFWKSQDKLMTWFSYGKSFPNQTKMYAFLFWWNISIMKKNQITLMLLLTNIKGLKLIYFTRCCNILMWKWSWLNSYADKIKQNMHFCLFCCYLVNIDNCCNDSCKWKKLVKWILAGWQFKKREEGRLALCFWNICL